MNQIERLKENDLGFYALPVEDQEFLTKILERKQSDIVRRSGADWAVKCNYKLLDQGIYRIHHDYNPEPDKPVFLGYELCEVKPEDCGRMRFIHNGGPTGYNEESTKLYWLKVLAELEK